MASQQPNAWQTANRSRNSASRTPNRSGTQSPNQSAPPTQAPRQAPPANNVWTQRSSIVSSSNGQTKSSGSVAQTEDAFQSINGFNAGEVKEFLSRDVGAVAAYKLPAASEAAGGVARANSTARSGSGMANGQPFFAQLAKQVATAEGGG